jgi:hypothetical protein
VAAEIKGDFDIDAKLVVGEAEAFEVVVDGKTIFSKARTDRFPDLGEVSAEIRKYR